MAPAAANTISLSGEQIQLLYHMVTHCKLDNVGWNSIGAKMSISGSAAQQRFGRLLQKLKAVDAVDNTGGSTTLATKPKNANKKGSPAQKGGKGRKLAEEEEAEEESHDSPVKKRATVNNGIKREKITGHALSYSDVAELKESLSLLAGSVELELKLEEDEV